MIFVIDLTWQRLGFQTLRLDYQSLLDACRNLTYVGLEYGTSFGQLDDLPSQVGTVALIFNRTVDMECSKV